MVAEAERHHDSQWAATCSVAAKVGPTPETVRKWVRAQEVGRGLRPGVTSEEHEHMRALERENRELRRANEILKDASAFFAVEMREAEERFVHGSSDARGLVSKLAPAASASERLDWARASRATAQDLGSLPAHAPSDVQVDSTSEVVSGPDAQGGHAVEVTTSVGESRRGGWTSSMRVTVAADGIIEDVTSAETPTPVNRPLRAGDVDVPYVPIPATVPDGSPGVWLSAPYWKPLAGALRNLTSLPVDSSGMACVDVPVPLGSFRSTYVALDRKDRRSSVVCVKVRALRGDGREVVLDQQLAAIRADGYGTGLVLPEAVSHSGQVLDVPQVSGPKTGMSSHSRTLRPAYSAKADRGRYFREVLRPRATRGVKSLMAGPHNRDATYAHAQAWWNGRAPGYPPQPNDCTNYVSQLLVAGGFTNDHVYGTTPGETFWPILGTNWYVAQEQRNWGWGRGYWSGLTPYKVNGSGGVSQIGTSGSRGDVVYYDYGSSGSIDHAAMVTGGNAGGIHYPAIPQHSTDRINFLLLNQLKTNPGMTAQVFSVQATHS